MSAEPEPTDARAATITGGGAVNLAGIDWAAIGDTPTPDQAVYEPLKEPYASHDNSVENDTRENLKRLNSAIGAVEDRVNGIDERVEILREDHDELRVEFDAHNHDSRYYRKFEVFNRTESDTRYVNEEDGYLSVYSGDYLLGGGRIDLEGSRTLNVDYDALLDDLNDDLETGGYTGPEYVDVIAGTYLEGGGRIHFGGSKSLAVNLDALTNTLDRRYIQEVSIDDVYVNTNKPNSIETMDGPLSSSAYILNERDRHSSAEGLVIFGESYYWGETQTDANTFRVIDSNDNEDVGFVFERYVPVGEDVQENWYGTNEGDRHELLTVRDPDKSDNFHYDGNEIIHAGNINQYI